MVELKLSDARYGQMQIVKLLSMSIYNCETFGIIAPSGAGKTTFLRCIAGLDVPALQFNIERTQNGHELPVEEISTVFQEGSVFEHLTVMQNAAFGVRTNKSPLYSRCQHLIRSFGLAGKEAERAGSLSGGERQRLALVMALLNDPSLLLLDEPFGSLDAMTRREMQIFFVEKIRGKVASVLVTHSIDEAVLLCDKILVGIDDISVIDVNTHDDDLRSFERSNKFYTCRNQVLDALERQMQSYRLNQQHRKG